MKQHIKANLSDEEFEKLFDDSRRNIIAERNNLPPDERKRIDKDPTLERWDGEAEPTNEGEDV
jgi:hypothetical protein